jgi:hypothetical protein
MTTRRQRTGNPRARRATRIVPEENDTTRRVSRPRNELDYHGNNVDWSTNDIVESMVGTKFGMRGTVTRVTRCTVDVRWAGNIVSTKPKSSCMIVTEEVLANRDRSNEDGNDPDVETFAMDAFPVLAQLMVRGAIMSGVTENEFDELLESLRIQFENADLHGVVNNDVERGVTERDHIVSDS